MTGEDHLKLILGEMSIKTALLQARIDDLEAALAAAQTARTQLEKERDALLVQAATAATTT